MRSSSPALWSQLGRRFAAERSELERVLAADATHDLAPQLALLTERNTAIAPVVDELRGRADKVGIVASLAHMHANRMLRSTVRTQELVLYEFLRRLHASARARR